MTNICSQAKESEEKHWSWSKVTNDINILGIIITGGMALEAWYSAEVFDVYTGESCQLSDLPKWIYKHTQVIFDNCDYLYKCYLVRMENWPVEETLVYN